MKYFKLINGQTYHINDFDEQTNRERPYYQDGRRYALCPSCETSIQLIGGENNITQNKSGKFYAAHTKAPIEGFAYDEDRKRNCVNYEGNANNWQGIYQRNNDLPEHEELSRFIDQNKACIAKDVGKLIGFNGLRKDGKTSAIFNKILESFFKNDGLRIAQEQFVPEYISRIIIERASPVNCWGAIPHEEIRNRIVQNPNLQTSIVGGQFKPDIETNLVCILNNVENPTQIRIRLLFGGEELDLKLVNAQVRSDKKVD
ncbi:hypothetical protein [Streptococcus gallolyticus]|uniref:Uncharacterized protein n=1 Tax=Streptococcus gallolyticus TaxID=315405 RepID=A0A139R4B1_9STRE|nr:hypothetical protein [Streptococcus gallolyticus]KXU09568.1 hypothetical protein SGADD03_00690 [Streptococcus gallolyticus]SFC70440.1 hypothetical protein SAMN02983012_2058 [Streptococcus gallolyticus]SFU73539.1 hypothetical protein SAMN05660328_10590 [Streptococcus gallolyticus]